jgi:antitoxin VapB
MAQGVNFDDTDRAICGRTTGLRTLLTPGLPRMMVKWYSTLVDVWTMALNIKNQKAHRLAEELSRLTGENLTVAVTESLRERLARIRRERGVSLADRLMEIGKDCARRLQEPYRSADHGDLLYDERGLPR